VYTRYETWLVNGVMLVLEGQVRVTKAVNMNVFAEEMELGTP
jgi:hypothetical protein